MLSQNELNSYPVLNFLGSDASIMTIAPPVNLTARTVFIVGRLRPDFTGTAAFILGPKKDVFHHLKYERLPARMLAYDETSREFDVYCTTNTRYHLFSLVYDPLSTNYSGFFNGCQSNSTTGVSVPAWQIGYVAGYSAGSYPLVGNIAEIIIYGTAKIGCARVAIERWLCAKYGLPCATSACP
eukprot:TRINITY_DN15370_c0_g1_i1.p2 TRINITY_DN15370_c0_g1~~TRINITY_DN15370_c0_g1_i1.p2  ORF type:complete len:183 (-),score=34.48 TRINITY_DN15370_c0_g1_i1:245-793(-)